MFHTHLYPIKLEEWAPFAFCHITITGWHLFGKKFFLQEKKKEDLAKMNYEFVVLSKRLIKVYEQTWKGNPGYLDNFNLNSREIGGYFQNQFLILGLGLKKY